MVDLGVKSCVLEMIGLKVKLVMGGAAEDVGWCFGKLDVDMDKDER
jgi:hypothetical protein